MNGLKRLMAVMLVGGAGFGLFVACGGNNEPGESCVLDSDCGADQACEGQVCVPTCATAADCLAGEVCEAGVNTALTVCRADNTSNNTTGNNTTANNTTVNNVPTVYYNVRIQSTTTGAGCEVTDPGPDIFGVGLEDSTGNVLGYGIVDWDSIQYDNNDNTDLGVIDGNGPDLGADYCPDMFDGNVVALGCATDASGSWIIVSFVDSGSQPVALDATADQVIRVYEWGGQCTTGSTDDTYNVDICTDTMAAKSGDDSSCTIQVIVDGAAETSGDVAGF